MHGTVWTLKALSKQKSASCSLYSFQWEPAGCLSARPGDNGSALNVCTLSVFLPLLLKFDHVKLSLLVAGCRAECCASRRGILFESIQHQPRPLWLSLPGSKGPLSYRDQLTADITQNRVVRNFSSCGANKKRFNAVYKEVLHQRQLDLMLGLEDISKRLLQFYWLMPILIVVSSVSP